MNDALNADAFAALADIARGLKSRTLTPCVARNAKLLSGLKYVAYGRRGQLTVTDKGREALFLKACIDGLNALSKNPQARLEPQIQALLARKGHIQPNPESGGFEVTDKGRESLADILASWNR